MHMLDKCSLLGLNKYEYVDTFIIAVYCEEME